jgi:hypothetical protein
MGGKKSPLMEIWMYDRSRQPGGQLMNYQVTRDRNFGRIFAQWHRHVQAPQPLEDYRFVVKGYREGDEMKGPAPVIGPDDTPEDLNLSDGASIDVFIKQNGG